MLFDVVFVADSQLTFVFFHDKLECGFQVFMFYGLSSGPRMVPDSLNMLALDDANLPAASPKPPTPTERTSTGQKSRRQKNRRNKSKKAVMETTTEADDDDANEVGGASHANEVAGAFHQLNVHDEGSTGFWAALGSSDSEFSDVELGSSSLSVSQCKRTSSTRVRLHSLACFHAFIKVSYFLIFD